jgi:hypothetical protein
LIPLGSVQGGGASQAHIDDFGFAVGRQQDIRGLDISVNDSAFARMLKGFGDLASKVSRIVDTQGALFQDELSQVDPFDELEDDVIPMLGFADVVDTGDIGVIEFCCALGFDAKASHRIGFAMKNGYDFDCHKAVEPLVRRPEYSPHAPLAYERLDLVMVQGGSDQRLEVGSLLDLGYRWDFV